jgi:hypothetical protein
LVRTLVAAVVAVVRVLPVAPVVLVSINQDTARRYRHLVRTARPAALRSVVPVAPERPADRPVVRAVIWVLLALVQVVYMAVGPVRVAVEADQTEVLVQQDPQLQAHLHM